MARAGGRTRRQFGRRLAQRHFVDRIVVEVYGTATDSAGLPVADPYTDGNTYWGLYDPDAPRELMQDTQVAVEAGMVWLPHSARDDVADTRNRLRVVQRFNATLTTPLVLDIEGPAKDEAVTLGIPVREKTT